MVDNRNKVCANVKPSDLRRLIEHAANRLGFAAVGTAAAAPCERHALFVDWVRGGFHGKMNYLERHMPLRRDPREWLPKTRSIVMTAMRYPVNPAPGDGGFSSLAWGRDYHDVVRERLRQLGDILRKDADAGFIRIACDTAPLAEREWAVRAGLGWIGRQGQLINPEAGSCIVLGALLTDLELPSELPVPNRCGDCRLCLEACPTGALLGNGLIDARLCLAYLTVEPRALAPAGEDKFTGYPLFGCDRCTAVCPWNHAALRDREAVCRELQGNRQFMPTASQCLQMNETQFNERFGGSAVRRVGLARLRYNAAK